MEKETEVKETWMSWVVAMGCLLMFIIILGPPKLSGLIFVVFIEAFQTDRKWASTPFFLFVIVSCSLGPFVGYMGQKFGEEKTTLLGFVIAAIGFGGMFFAESMIAVNICFGVLYGIGLALGLALVPNILKKHFSKHINSATGIVFAGGSMGSLIFPPLAIYLFEEYGTTGTFLILSGLMLNGLPIVMLVMIAGKHKRPQEQRSQKKLLNETKEINVCPNEIISTTDHLDESDEYILNIVPAIHSEIKISNEEPGESSLKMNNIVDTEKIIMPPGITTPSSEVGLPTGVVTELLDRVSLSEPLDNLKENNMIQEQNRLGEDDVTMQQIQEQDNGSSGEDVIVHQGQIQEQNSGNKGVSGFMQHGGKQEQDSGNRGGGGHMPHDEAQAQNNRNSADYGPMQQCENILDRRHSGEISNSDVEHFNDTLLISQKILNTKNGTENKNDQPNHIADNKLNVTDSVESDSSVKTNVKHSNKILCDQNCSNDNEKSKEDTTLSSNVNKTEICARDIPGSAKRTSDVKKISICSSLKVFANPVFLVLMVLRSFHTYIITMISTTIIDYSRDKGIPTKYEFYFLMFYPFFDLVGRSAFVWVVDKGYVGYTMFQVVAWLVSALSLLGVILVTNFEMMLTYAAIFALSAGAQQSLASGLVFKFIEKEECIMAMTSRTVLYVPLSFTSFPLIGYFRNELKSYDGLYYLLIAIVIVCCALSPFVEIISKSRKRKKMAALEMEVAA